MLLHYAGTELDDSIVDGRKSIIRRKYDSCSQTIISLSIYKDEAAAAAALFILFPHLFPLVQIAAQTTAKTE